MPSNWSDLLRAKAAAAADLAPPAAAPEPVQEEKPAASPPPVSAREEVPVRTVRWDDWPADCPVGPIPDFDRPGEEQAIVILDVFGTKVAVPLASLERLIAYNRGCPKPKASPPSPKKIAPGLFDEEQ